LCAPARMGATQGQSTRRTRRFRIRVRRVLGVTSELPVTQSERGFWLGE
jgi:hypothetical protein